MECVHLAKRFLVSTIPKLQHDITGMQYYDDLNDMI